MKIGFIGLGKMGGNMVLRLLKNGHEVVAYDRSEEAVAKVVAKGAEGAASREECTKRAAMPKGIRRRAAGETLTHKGMEFQKGCFVVLEPGMAAGSVRKKGQTCC